MIDFNFDKLCYGCGMCETVCPQNAITMIENQQGFKVPSVNKNLCIDCNKCDRACVRLVSYAGNDINLSRAFTCWAKEDSARRNSTSGGIFYVLAQETIRKGGVVCGCVWNESMEAVIVACNTLQELEKMRGAKYVQSYIQCYDELEKYLSIGIEVLFSGVPCQIAAVQKKYGKYQNLITVAILCETASSPKAWRKYRFYLEDKCGSKMIDAKHRKTGKYGWLSPMSQYSFKNGYKIETLSYSLDPYVHSMIYGYFSRESCFSCQYKGKNTPGDIILGDYWGASTKDIIISGNLGCSMVCALTDKGKEKLFNLKDQIEIKEVSVAKAIKGNPAALKGMWENGKRLLVLEKIDSLDWNCLMEQYCEVNTRKIKIQKLLHKLNMAGIAKIIMRSLKR